MKLLALALAVTLLGCGGSAPVPSQYLLRAEPPQAGLQANAPARIGLRRIGVAPYLAQSGIVVENGKREVWPAHHHRWAEPLEDAVRFYLRAELSRALGEHVGEGDATDWEQAVDVFVERLHGTTSGEALLVADFRIERADRPASPAEYRFSRSQALDRDGYAALVDAEAELLRQLAQAIADAIREQPR